MINPKGTILAPTFGGGANSLVTQALGDDAIISSDFGGNPPYEKMHDVARICFKYWLAQSNVLFIIGGKSNNTDIYETFRAMADALRQHFGARGATPEAAGSLQEFIDKAKVLVEALPRTASGKVLRRTLVGRLPEAGGGRR